ncbi:hypothetical protein R3P38DRAFT_2998604 [Favolaschia claudopus]|uniref:Uncharacterized protein n=1 Tax=Favolaschia claudopus TaxID=2862362 RepID=A0AAW0AR79_9AGAR
MRSNPYNIARLIVLSLQVHLHVLVVLAASWNVNVTLAAGQSLPAAALCLLVTSLAFIISMSLRGLLCCLKNPSAFLTSLKFESGLLAVLFVFQFAATIGTTVHVLPAKSAAVMSASYALLVAAAWMTTVIAGVFLGGLIRATMLHKPFFPEIWSVPAASVDWFVDRQLDANSMQNDSWTRYIGDIESSAIRKQRFGKLQDCEANLTSHSTPFAEKAPWAHDIRRGVDEPFACKAESDVTPQSSPSMLKLNAALPPLPLRVESKAKSAGSRFIERFRDSHVPVRTAQTPFPSGVADHDMPIPLPRRSEWVRADVHET